MTLTSGQPRQSSQPGQHLFSAALDDQGPIGSWSLSVMVCSIVTKPLRHEEPHVVCEVQQTESTKKER